MKREPSLNQLKIFSLIRPTYNFNCILTTFCWKGQGSKDNGRYQIKKKCEKGNFYCGMSCVLQVILLKQIGATAMLSNRARNIHNIRKPEKMLL